MAPRNCSNSHTSSLKSRQSKGSNREINIGKVGWIQKRKIAPQNIVIRLFERSISLHHKTHKNSYRKFYQTITPNFTVCHVKKPPCFLRKFSPCGRYLIAFSADQTSVEIYDYNGAAAANELLTYCPIPPGDTVLSGNDPLVGHVLNNIFDRFFRLRHSVHVAANLEQLNRECSLFTSDGRFVLVGSASTSLSSGEGRLADAYRNNESVTPNPRASLDDYTLHLIELESGVRSDSVTLKHDKVFLAHNQGLNLYRSTLAVLSVQHQTLHIYHINTEGKFIAVRTVGRTCYVDDDYFLNSCVAHDCPHLRHQHTNQEHLQEQMQVQEHENEQRDSYQQQQHRQQYQQQQQQQHRQQPQQSVPSSEPSQSQPSQSQLPPVPSSQPSQSPPHQPPQQPPQSEPSSQPPLLPESPPHQPQSVPSSQPSQPQPVSSSQPSQTQPVSSLQPPPVSSLSAPSEQHEAPPSDSVLRVATRNNGPATAALNTAPLNSSSSAVSHSVASVLNSGASIFSNAMASNSSNVMGFSSVDSSSAASNSAASNASGINSGVSSSIITNSSGVYSMASNSFGVSSMASDSHSSKTSHSSTSLFSPNFNYTHSITPTASTHPSFPSSSSHSLPTSFSQSLPTSSSHSVSTSSSHSVSTSSSNSVFTSSSHSVSTSSSHSLSTSSFHSDPVSSVSSHSLFNSSPGVGLGVGSRIGLGMGPGVSTRFGPGMSPGLGSATFPGVSSRISSGTGSGVGQSPGRVDLGPGRVDQGPARVDHGPGRVDQGPGRVGQGPGRMGQGTGRVDQGYGTQSSSWHASTRRTSSPGTRRHHDHNEASALIYSLKHRVLVFLYRLAVDECESSGSMDALRHFYASFDILLHLRMWKMQLLDDDHVLIKYASEDVVTLRSSEPSGQPTYFVVYNMQTTEVVGVYESSSQKLMELYEQFTDFFRNARLPCEPSHLCSPANNIYARQLHERHKATLINARGGGVAEASKRLLAQLPVSCQAFSPSPYLDLSLFMYQDKWVSIMERPKTAADHPIRFYGRDSGLLKFSLDAGARLSRLSRLTPQDSGQGAQRRLVAFTFHPSEPFTITVQKHHDDYVLSFHVRHHPT